jgi:hypothetical protein
MKLSNRKLLVIAGSAIALLLMLVVCGSAFSSFLAVMADLNREPEPLPFSVEGWNSSRYDADGNFSYTRYRMVDDLLQSYDLHGWPMTEVEKLLNVPDKEEDKDTRYFVYYDLGNGLDFLILETDAERRVVANRVYKH